MGQRSTLSVGAIALNRLATKMTKALSSISTFTNDALGDSDAVHLAEKIRNREISTDEAIEAAIARAGKAEPHISAIVTEGFERARYTGSTHPDGAFGGVPTFIKDMTAVEGLPTRAGTNALANVGPAKRTDPIARQFEQLGTVCLGKSKLPEFGFVCSTEFPDGEPTRNPWNLDHSVGGSSGGSAALVASGVVPIAHAADGGGSIRIPASAAGLVGFKTSSGRVIGPKTDKYMPLVLGAYGVVSRTVRDTCVYLSESEKIYHLEALPRVGTGITPIRRRLRVGVIDSPPTDAIVDKPTQRALSETVELLESLGHEVAPMSVPTHAGFADDFVLYWSVFALAIQKFGTKLFDPSFDAEALTPLSIGLADHAKKNLKKMPGAIRRLKRSQDFYAEATQGIDIVLSPTVGQIPPPIGHIDMSRPYDEIFPRVMEWACFTPLANATGTPAVSLPLGHDDETNLPIGLQFGAGLGKDRLLLELALELEESKPFRSLPN